MEVILSQDVPSMGKAGDIVKVKDGHARNYLIPRQMAMAATKDNKKKFEAVKAKQAALYQAKMAEAQGQAEKLAKVSCTVNVEAAES